MFLKRTERFQLLLLIVGVLVGFYLGIHACPTLSPVQPNVSEAVGVKKIVLLPTPAKLTSTTISHEKSSAKTTVQSNDGWQARCVASASGGRPIVGAWGFFCSPTLSNAELDNVWAKMSAAFGGNTTMLFAVLDVAERYNTMIHGTTRESVKLVIYAAKGDDGAKLIIQEHATHDEYGIDTTKFAEGDCMVDVGSNLGLVIIRAVLDAQPTRVIGVEAAPGTYVYQLLNLWTNIASQMRAGTVVPLHNAIGATDGGFLDLVYNPAASTATAAWRDIRVGHSVKIKVPIVKMNSVLKEHASGFRMALLKMDCEGCEYDLIPSLNDDEWGNIGRVIGEVHAQWMGDRRPSQAVEDFCLHRLCAKRGGDPNWSKGITSAQWCSKYRTD